MGFLVHKQGNRGATLCSSKMQGCSYSLPLVRVVRGDCSERGDLPRVHHPVGISLPGAHSPDFVPRFTDAEDEVPVVSSLVGGTFRPTSQALRVATSMLCSAGPTIA